MRRLCPTNLGFVSALFVVLLFCAPLEAQYTGTWSGNYLSYGLNGCAAATATSVVTLTLTQNGTNVVGVAQFSSLPPFSCMNSEPIRVPLSGAIVSDYPGMYYVSGALSMPEDSGPASVPFVLSPTQKSATLYFRVDLGGTRIQCSVAQQAAASDTGASGDYGGTYDLTSVQNGCTTVSSGPITGQMTQAGPYLAGVFDAGGRLGLTGVGCATMPKPDVPLQFSAQINGTTISGTLYFWGGANQGVQGAPFTGTLSGGKFQGGAGGGSSGSLTFTLLQSSSSSTPPPTLPLIATFSATPSSVANGGSATLSWVTTNATSVSIDHGVGVQPPAGTAIVHPAGDTAYTLTATGSGGTATAQTVVVVGLPPSPAKILITRYPGGMIYDSSGHRYCVDRFCEELDFANIGGTDTTTTLSYSSEFNWGRSSGPYNPYTWSVSAGGNRGFLAFPKFPMPAGQYQGTVTANFSGGAGTFTVAVPWIVVASVGVVSDLSTPVLRTDLIDPAAQNPSGTVSFKNNGASAVSGVISTDVPWIVLQQSPFLTLGAGETKQVSFAIDRSLRAHFNVVGGAYGAVYFSYPSANGGTATGTATKNKALDASAATGSQLAVSVVDVATPSVSTAAPPALTSGEIAYFIPGVSSQSGTLGDLSMSNRGTSAIDDLKMYYTAGSSASQLASIGAVASNANASFPNVANSVFGDSTHTGTIQLRSSHLSDLGVSEMQLGAAPDKLHASMRPLFRSDRGVRSGDALMLPGVSKSGSTSTDLYVQEVTGNPATLAIDFIDAAGHIVSSRTSDTLSPFGTLRLTDAVPAGCVTVRVRNTSTGVAAIDAYALISDSSTGDRITIRTTSGFDTQIGPVFSAAGSSDLTLNLTNVSDAPITVTATTVPISRHTHAAGPLAGGPPVAGPTTVTIPPLGLQQLHVTGPGITKISGSTEVRVAGVFSVAQSGATSRSGVDLLPASRSITLNTVQTFSGIEDSSEATVAAARGLTFRTNLLLAETFGMPVTVRVTLRFAETDGGTMSRDIRIGGGNCVLLNDLARSIIGADRDKYGDFHDARLDIQVIDGEGSIMAFPEMVDNGTGSVLVRDE